MLRSLDLFSGVGGLTHALRDIAEPTGGYCEVEPTRRRTLKNLFAKGLLPEATIHNDIQALDGTKLRGSIDLIAGGWPCFVAGTLVLTNNGYKNIEAVTGQELLMTHSGSFKEIENLQRKYYDGKMCRVWAKGHCRSIECTDTHRFYVRTRENREPDWVPARSLTRDHYVGLAVNVESKVPTFSEGERSETLDDAEAWYMLGMYMSGGCHRKDLAESFPKYRNATWLPVLEDIEKEWTIPEWVHSAPTHLIQEFVEGYMAFNGTKRRVGSKTTWTMCVENENTALGMQRLLAKLGHCFEVADEGDGYEVIGRVPRSRTKNTSFVDDGYVWFRISSVELYEPDEPLWVYNFEVRDDNSYVVENAIVANCRGFSSIGKRNGFEHPQSALFVHFARLVDEIRPAFVFQENVPGVPGGPGLDDVIASFDKSGYDATWMVLPAYAVGAPHNRKRWFCLAVRRDVKDFQLLIPNKYVRHDWSHEPVPRMKLDRSTRLEDKVRLSELGNSVVPDLVRLAFMLMFTGLQKAPEELWDATTLELARPLPSGMEIPATGPGRYAGSYIDGKVEKIRLPFGVVPRKPNYGLVLLPDAYVHDGPLKSTPIGKPHNLPMFGTPRGGCLGASNVLAKRSRHDLYTSLRFEKSTPDELRPGQPNPQWTEWLMGYNVVDWTEMAPIEPIENDKTAVIAESVKKPRKPRKPRKPKEDCTVPKGEECA
jgi:hypothetical protein